MKQCLLIALTALGFFTLGGCSTPAQDRAKLKEEIKREILAELRQQRQTPVLASSQQDREEMKKEIEREILAKIQNQVQSQVHAIASEIPDLNDRSIQWKAVPVGRAEGLILHNGQGLAGCKVKLVRILRSQSVIEMFNTIREGAEFTEVTDEQGKYVFDKIPEGVYKLKWQLPNDRGWIRRLRDKPDAIISEGQTALLKSVETNRRLVAH